MTESTAELLAHFDGRFEVREEYAGGEGRTLRVTARDDGSDLVVKVLPDGVQPLEASLLLALRHPAIPSVREVGHLADGRAFVVREFVAGEALEQLPSDPVELQACVREILEVLAYVHLRSIVHLDLKPPNLVRGRDGRLHLLDFGLSARTGERGSGGTPYFAAPELLLGAVPDARADLFSLGAMIAQALWPGGRLPLTRLLTQFPAADFWAAAGVTAAEFQAPFDGFLQRCVSRRPARRFQDAQAAMEFLCGGSGRPSPSLLMPDPIELWRAEIESIANGADEDIVLRGASAADRRAIAMHLQCTVPGIVAMQERDDEVALARGGVGSSGYELPPLDAARLAPQLAAALGLQGAALRAATDWVIDQGGIDSQSVGGLLHSLVELGDIVPAGSRWVWPTAQSGRLGRRLSDREPSAVDVSEANVRAMAARGRRETAVAMWHRGAAADPAKEAPLRLALAEGLLDAGEPTKALPLCADDPVLHAQALLDMGQIEGAERELATAPDGEHHPRHRRVTAQLLLARGQADAAAQGLGGPRTVQEQLTLAAALETAGHDAQCDAVLDQLIAAIEGTEQPFLRASWFTICGHLARRRGDLEAAAEFFETAAEILFGIGHVRHTASARLNLGVIEKDLGKFDRAVERLREARALYEHAGDTAGMAIAAANLGSTALARGDAAAAQPWLRDAAAELLRLGKRDAGRQAEAMLARATAQLEALPPATRAEHSATLPEPMPESPGPSRELFRTFLAVNRKLAHESDLDQAMRHLLDAAVTLSGGRQGFLLVLRDDGVQREFQSGDSGASAQAFSRSLAHRAIEAQRTLTGIDVLADRELQDMPSIRNLEVRSAICAPFCSAAGTRGAIYVEHAGRADAFGEGDKETLEVLADQAAIAVDRMQREEALAAELHQSRRELAVVQRVGRRKPTALLGESKAMQSLRAEIQKLAPLDLPVLVQGDTGTGKELVARALHEQSGRTRNPFVAENCSALPAELLERELFGHVQGAFTGADSDRPGLLELASGGTLFLDEVGDMPGPMQAKLLRALQEQSIRRVGGSEMIPVDLRVVAATHKDLRAMIAAGEFREDLFFRLAAVEVRVPPLRDRGDDVIQLAEHFLARHGKQHGRTLRLSAVAQAAIRDYPWPGNVRELDHVMARAALLTDGDEVIDLQLPKVDAASRVSPQAGETGPVESLKEAERRAMVAAMQALNGDKTAAAKALGISRTALYEKLKRHGIS